MSARIAPEPVSIGISLNAEYKPRVDRTTRPIEPAAASADRQQNKAFGRSVADGIKPRSGDRPPGKDPSVPPQALFDAALIAAEFKPVTKYEPDAKELPEAPQAKEPAKASEPQNIQVQEKLSAKPRVEVERQPEQDQSAKAPRPDDSPGRTER